ncbi:MAG TPA: GC-type dockerin domain-anchored protein [Phycisphaerales bacterium]|nr:GC-type dockerin domain-anchored protein [Phycisphaerales bacterium]
MLLTTALALAVSGPTATVVNFDNQPPNILATPESLFFRQYASLGLVNNNSSAAGGYIFIFPAIPPTRTFITPRSGTHADYVRCAGMPLAPVQRLDFAAPQQNVSMWIAVQAPVSLSFVVRGTGPTPIQSFQQAFTPGAWHQVSFTSGDAPAIRSVQTTPVNANGTFAYVDWAMDDLTFTGVQACGASDVGSTGGTDGGDGQLNNNDFVVFIDRFFAGDPRADVGVTGGLPGRDEAFNNNDFVVFIDQFFDGCV